VCCAGCAVRSVPRHNLTSQKAALLFNLTTCGVLAKKGLFVFLSDAYLLF
jgi:hypothetical protein